MENENGNDGEGKWGGRKGDRGMRLVMRVVVFVGWLGNVLLFPLEGERCGRWMWGLCEGKLKSWFSTWNKGCRDCLSRETIYGLQRTDCD